MHNKYMHNLVVKTKKTQGNVKIQHSSGEKRKKQIIEVRYQNKKKNQKSKTFIQLI